MKKNKTVAILLSTYNGEKYLDTLLCSLLKQKKVQVDIIVRDDGSNDNTQKILREYELKYSNIIVNYSENLGYAKSFWQLLQNVGEYDYYAFCDQDDIWDETKIFSAIECIEKNEIDIPILYTSKITSVDNNINVISNDAFPCKNVLNIYESFQKSIIPGCVFVFNNKLIKLLKKYNGYMESHDWATYIIASVFGKVIYDDNSYIKYRIHSNNTIGKDNKYKIFVKKIKRFFKKSKRTRSKFAKDFYETYKDIIPTEFYLDIKKLAYYRTNLKYKISLIFDNKFKGMIFKLYILLNKV